MEWMNYTPEFECDNYNRDMLKYSPWSGHRLFAYDLIANTRPETVVELGSFLRLLHVYICAGCKRSD